METFENLVAVRPDTECDQLAERFGSAYPFPHVCIDGFFSSSFMARLIDGFPVAGTPEYDRYCDGEGGASRRNYANGEPATFPQAFRDLHALSGSQAFLDYLSRVTGIGALQFDPKYVGAGLRESMNGAVLPPHLDFNYHPDTLHHRRLNFLLYLNPDWDPAWGGNIQMHLDPNTYAGHSMVSSFTPLANRVVIFETSEKSWHAFDRVLPPPGRGRRAWSIYYYTRDREGGDSIQRRNTEYVEPPLPGRFQAGYALDDGDVSALQEMLFRRDSRIRMLYEQRRTFEDRYSQLWHDYVYYVEKYRDLLPPGHPDKPE